jgi:D-glycero-D-manno-heptose 1,7-bisphosphate phosphatase
VSRFVLLDRDGVINEPVPGGYVTCWEHFIFIPGALDALRLLALHNYEVIVVSNQSCVAKNLLSLSELAEITRRFARKVREHGGRIREVYYCTHSEDDQCDCRKPKPGLLLRAQKDHGFVFRTTFLLGDSESDLRAAHQAGCPALLICPDGSNNFKEMPYRPLATFTGLGGAVEFLVGRDKRGE